MNETGATDRFVDSWLAKRARPMTAAHMADLLVSAIDAVCSHSRTILGDVTLEAICSRTLSQARLKHPFLAALGPRIASTRSEDSRAALAATASSDELHAATRFIVVDLLAVLARLTGGVLTLRLYADLEAVPVVGDENVESRRARQKKDG